MGIKVLPQARSRLGRESFQRIVYPDEPVIDESFDLRIAQDGGMFKASRMAKDMAKDMERTTPRRAARTPSARRWGGRDLGATWRRECPTNLTPTLSRTVRYAA